eukprot:gene10846-11001_t
MGSEGSGSGRLTEGLALQLVGAAVAIVHDLADQGRFAVAVLARLRSLYLIQRITLTIHNPRKSKLSGLDGEATEHVVKDLANGQATGGPAAAQEQEHVLAAELGQASGRGLAVLLQLLLMSQQLPVAALSRVRGQLAASGASSLPTIAGERRVRR